MTRTILLMPRLLDGIVPLLPSSQSRQFEMHSPQALPPSCCRQDHPLVHFETLASPNSESAEARLPLVPIGMRARPGGRPDNTASLSSWQ